MLACQKVQTTGAVATKVLSILFGRKTSILLLQKHRQFQLTVNCSAVIVALAVLEPTKTFLMSCFVQHRA